MGKVESAASPGPDNVESAQQVHNLVSAGLADLKATPGIQNGGMLVFVPQELLIKAHGTNRVY